MNRYRVYGLLFAVLLGFWFLLSGRFEPTFVILGVLAAAGITALTGDLVWRAIVEPLEGDRLPGALGRAGRIPRTVRRLWWFAVYNVWLLGQVALSNIKLAAIILRPRLPVEPAILTFRSRMRSHIGRVVLANSITLTPGTVTVELNGNEFVVHVIVPSAASLILTGAMQRRIARFTLEADEPLDVSWKPVRKGLPR